MAIRKYKPTTPGRRGASVSDFAEVTRSTPEKSLVAPKSKTGGRNNQGRITTRHIGGGHKQAYRLVMPATSQYTRTLYRFYVCVLPAASDGTCW